MATSLPQPQALGLLKAAPSGSARLPRGDPASSQRACCGDSSLMSHKPQHRLHPGIAHIPVSPTSQHHTPSSKRVMRPEDTVGSPTAQSRAWGYLWGWGPREVGWHCRMMLRMLCVGRGMCSEFSRECCTGSPFHCQPVGAVRTNRGSWGLYGQPAHLMSSSRPRHPLPAFCE